MSNSRRAITLWVLVALIAAAGFAASTVSPANAAAVLMATVGMKSNAPAPTCPAPYVYSGTKPGCIPCPPRTKYDTATKQCKAVAPALGGATVVVESSSIGSFSFNLRGTIVADVHLKGTKKNSPKCGVADGMNGYKVVNGRWYYRFERNVKYCPNPNSPTGYAKVGGGDTGKDCENPFKPGRKAPGPVLKGPITELSSFNVHKTVKAKAEAVVHGQCPGIDVGGEASASGLVSATINQRLILKAKGNASVLKSLLKETLKGNGVAKAVARLHLDCNMPTQTITQPGTTTTQTVTQPGTTTTQTTTTTTTTTTPSPQIRVEQLQELYPDETANICADTKNVPAGGGTVVFSVQAGTAPKGTFRDASEPAPSGNGRVCDNFQAPSSTGTNQYFVKLIVGGQQVDQDSLWVEIIQPASTTNPSIP